MAALWDAIDNNSSQFLFLEDPINWGTTANSGAVLGMTLYSGGPAPSASLTHFSESFAYDKIKRLISASDSGGWSRGFDYDPYGNMWVSSNSGVPLAGNAPTSNVFTAHNQIQGVTYDAAGNQTGINGNTATYDGENRMVTVTESPAFGGGAETLYYDAGEQRVKKAFTGGGAFYVYDAFGQLATEYAPNYSTVSKEYIRFKGQIVAIQNAATGTACATCYLSYDYLGSVRMVTDQNAKVIARHDYLPFGEEIPAGSAGRGSQFGGTDNVSQRFTGQFRDTETDEDYFNARYFGAALGRLISPDPLNAGANPADPQTWNAYAYVRNDPLNATDPTGMMRTLNGWVDDGGPGNGEYTMDGVDVPSDMAMAAIGGGGAVGCPNNMCQGFVTDRGRTSYAQYTASAGTAQAYIPVSQLGNYPYDSNGSFLTPSQFQKTIAPAVEAQKEALAATAASQTGKSYEDAYAALTAATNADGTTNVSGGNVQFSVDASVAAGVAIANVVAAGFHNRTPGAPSIHLHDGSGFYYLDTMSPYPIFGLGLIVHFGVDVLAGTLFYGPVPIPR